MEVELCIFLFPKRGYLSNNWDTWNINNNISVGGDGDYDNRNGNAGSGGGGEGGRQGVAAQAGEVNTGGGGGGGGKQPEGNEKLGGNGGKWCYIHYNFTTRCIFLIITSCICHIQIFLYLNMIAWILQISIISFLFIFLVHHLITFLKSTLTIPKIKDLVDSPSQKYKNIYAQLSNNNNNNHTNNNTNNQKEEPIKVESSMKQDLKSFLKKQLNPDQSVSDIYSLDSTYSPYV